MKKGDHTSRQKSKNTRSNKSQRVIFRRTNVANAPATEVQLRRVLKIKKLLKIPHGVPYVVNFIPSGDDASWFLSHPNRTHRIRFGQKPLNNIYVIIRRAGRSTATAWVPSATEQPDPDAIFMSNEDRAPFSDSALSKAFDRAVESYQFVAIDLPTAVPV